MDIEELRRSINESLKKQAEESPEKSPSARMMRFHILTIFPDIFDSYFEESLFKRARRKKIISVRAYDLRAFTKDKHKKVDDRPFGGGPGMVLAIQPVWDAVKKIKSARSKIIKKI